MKKIAQFTTTLILVACPMLGQAATYTYDDLNRVTKAVYSNGDSVEYSYDAGGNITSIASSAKNDDDDDGHDDHDGDHDDHDGSSDSKENRSQP